MSTTAADSSIEGAHPGAGERPHGILIVDDEPAILESLELTLGSDYRVFCATSGEEGLEILGREEVSLIISDQVLPTMSGVEFLEHALRNEPGGSRRHVRRVGHSNAEVVGHTLCQPLVPDPGPLQGERPCLLWRGL